MRGARLLWPLLLLVGACDKNGGANVGGNTIANGSAVAKAGSPVRRELLPERPRVVEVITAPGDVRGGAEVDGALWLATSGGLVRANRELVEEARFTTLDGLPSNDVWAVVVDGATLWLGTASGALQARLDGGRLVDLVPLGPAAGLPAESVRDLALVDGTLYAATWNGGVAVWTGARFVPLVLGPAARKPTRLRSDGRRLWLGAVGGVARIDLPARGDAAAPSVRWFTRRDGLPDETVWDVLPAGGGAMIAVTTAGPARIDGDQAAPLREPLTGPLARVAALVDAEVPGRGAPRVRNLVALDGGRLLACAEDGAQLLESDGRTRAALRPAGLPSPDLTALAVGEDALYVGTFDHGVARVRVDRVAGTLEAEPVPGLIDERINALAVRSADGAEELWVGTTRGATRVRAGQVTHFLPADGLPDEHVNAILAEPDGVWLATTRGLARVTAAGVERITVENGLPTTRLTSLARGADGALWVGTAHGLARFDGRSWSLARAYHHELPDDYVTAVAVLDGDVWAGTFASGLARRGLGGWTQYREADGLPSSWVNPGAIAAWSDRLWIGSVERGVGVWRGGAWSALDVADGLPGRDVTAFAADDGALWVATRGGLARVVVAAATATGPGGAR